MFCDELGIKVYTDEGVAVKMGNAEELTETNDQGNVLCLIVCGLAGEKMAARPDFLALGVTFMKENGST